MKTNTKLIFFYFLLLLALVCLIAIGSVIVSAVLPNGVLIFIKLIKITMALNIWFIFAAIAYICLIK